MIEMIFYFYDFLVSISYVISHNLKLVYEPFEEFGNFHVTNGVS